MTDNHPLDRRTFLKGAAATTAAVTVPMTSGPLFANNPDSFTLALQGYSLKELNLPSVLRAAKRMGVEHLELFDRQLSVHMSSTDRKRVRKLTDRIDAHVTATYTEEFKPDKATNRSILEYGQKLGLAFFSCRPGNETLSTLNDLLPDYDPGIAVHNTTAVPGEDQTLSRLSDVQKALDRYDHIDACVDVGNFKRGGVDPITALDQLDGRILNVHLKDVDEDGRETAIGAGTVGVQNVLNHLDDMGYQGLVTIEYTRHPEDITRRIADLKKAVNTLRTWME